MSTTAVLPRVDGRHRNGALAARRREEAIRLVTSGRTYQQVADELGYANRGTVHRIVQEALASRLVNSVDELRNLELQRLDALQQANWDAALAGDVVSARLVCMIISQRCRLLGLVDGPRRRPHRDRKKGETVGSVWTFASDGSLLPRR